MRLLSLLFAVVGLAGAQEERNPRTTPADASAGAQIFRSHCADCHGITGKGGKGPDLTTGVYFHGDSDAALFRNITDGIPGTAMPSQFFSADQIWQVVTHVRSLARGGSRAAPPGDAAAGARLFESKGCSGCHLVKGKGGIQGPELSFIGSQRPVDFLKASILDPAAQVDRAFWTADIVMENGAAHRGFILNEDTYYVQMLTQSGALATLPRKDFRAFSLKRTSSMPSYKGKLTDPELDHLVAYLWTLRRPRSK
jgi:putative heme-binding domain-containing protein